MSDELCDLVAIEQVAMLRAGTVSARELLAAHVARIEAVNPRLNAVVAFDPEPAQRQAARVDEVRAAGSDPGPLAGLVTAFKDLTETADHPTTHGSPLFAGHRPSADSLLVQRMKSAGALAVGKTNTPEFGAGSHTFNPVYGLTRNAFDPTRSAGGSSGGAAVALTTGMVAIADGSDVGGSLRNPAAWSNIVGLRPSPGVVPRIAPGNAWSTLPTEGPMARTIRDLVLLLRVLAAPDIRDPRYRPLLLDDLDRPRSRPLRVAWSRDLGGLPIEPEVLDVLDRFRTQVEDLGWSVVEAEPDLSGADECFEVLRAWSYANGPAGQLGDRLNQVKATVAEEVRRGVALSAHQVAAAHAHLAVLWRRGVAFFERFDLLVAPVTSVMPFPVEHEYPPEVAGRPMASYTEWMRVVSRVTVLGLPALSLPAGFGPSGLPVGAQLVGRPWGDGALLAAALTLEDASGHGRRRPPR